MKTADELWRIVSRRGLKPLPKTSVSEWADEYRQLSAGVSAEPGQWKTSRAEYQREIMDSFTMPGIHRIVVKSAAQIGKSDIMNNAIGRFAHLDPAAIMMIQPTIEMAMDFSKSRIAPMIRDTKVLSRLFFDVRGTGKTRDANNTILSKVFPGGRLIMCGANSPAGLASRPVRILLCDEVDRFPVSAGGEGDPVDLAGKRMTTFWNNVMGLFSTPTNEGESRIDIEYMAGTQEEWQYECPNCGEYHILDHRQMEGNYEEKRNIDGEKMFIVSEVKWRCPDCGLAFDELTMKRARQKYVAQNPDALKNGIRSFWVNAFSSPWLSWKDIMREWYEARGIPQREQVVMNTRFGLSYRLTGAYSDENVFLKRREEYRAQLPAGVLLLTAAVDVQDNRLEYEICGWGVDEECWGIQKGVVLGKPNIAATWQELDRVLDAEYAFADGKCLPVARTFVDSGFQTMAVYEYCRANVRKGRFPIKGRGGMGVQFLAGSEYKQKHNVLLTTLGVNEGKQEIMSRLGIEKTGAQYFHFPAEDDFLSTPRGYDEAYFKGLISEQKVLHRAGGMIYAQWEPVSRKIRNEPLDLRVYNLAAMKSCRPDWTKYKAVLAGESQPMAKPAQNVVKIKSRAVDIW